MVNAANETLVRSIYATQYATAANGSMRHEIFAIVLPSTIFKCAPFMPFPTVWPHVNGSLFLQRRTIEVRSTGFTFSILSRLDKCCSIPLRCPAMTEPAMQAKYLLRPPLRGHCGGICADQLVDSGMPAAAQLVRKVGLDAGDETQPVEDERAVELDQAR